MDANLSYVLREEPPENLSEPAPTVLDGRAQSTPHKEALVYVSEAGREAITFRELSQKTQHLAAWFREFGLRKGDRVSIFSRNCLEYGLCDLALQRLGVCLVRLYTSFSAQQDLPRMIQLSQSRLLIVQDCFIDTMLGIIPEIRHRQDDERLKSGQYPDLEQVIILGQARDGFIPFNADYSASEADLREVAHLQSFISMDDDCTIMPTSGSTGKSKLGVVSYDGYTNLLYQTFLAGGLDRTDRLFTDRPMAHPLGSIMALVQTGCTIVITNPLTSQQGKSLLHDIIRTEKITAAIFLPYLMYDIIQAGECQELTSMKFAISSGQAATRDIMARISEVLNVFICYGCTEGGDIACTKPGDDLDTIVSTVGRPIPHLEVRVADHTGRVVPRNTTGHIEIKGRSFLRYHGDPDRTRESQPFGWFRPGDLGQIDDKGRLKILGRDSEVISMGARKVFPAEVENLVMNHTGVDKAVAFGVPDPRLHETVAVCVRPKHGAKLTGTEVLDFISGLVKEEESLTGLPFAPSHVFVADTFPLTASGKVDRKGIKEECLKSLVTR